MIRKKSTNPTSVVWTLALKIVLIYSIYGFSWVYFSDRLIFLLVDNSNPLQGAFQTIKGFLFIGITSPILFSYLWHYFSKLKESERKLKESEARWKSLITHAPVPIMAIDYSGNILFTNNNLNHILETDVIDKKIFDIIPPEFHEDCHDKINTVFNKKIVSSVELILTGEKKKKMWYEMRLAPISNEEKVVSIISFLSDIMLQKRVEKENSLLVNAVKSISESVIVTNLKGKVLFVNKAFENDYGFSFDDILGKPIDILFSKTSSNKSVNQIIKKTLNGHWEEEATHRRKNDIEFQVNFSSSVVINEKGQQVALIFVSHDLTEKKEIEKQLFQAQKMESIGMLAGGIAHDFNNILGIILGYISLMKMEEMNPKRLDWGLDSIIKAVERASSLVKQILMFSRKTDVLFETVKLNATVKEIQKLVNETFPKNINIQIELDANLPYLKADHNQLHQCILNLLVNARDAMPDGGNIMIKTSIVDRQILQKKFADASESQYVCLSVADEGSGIEPSKLEHIFEPFFTTKEKGKGTGLGLSVVYGIISSHNGFIDVSSEIGKGTSFYLYFPVNNDIVMKTEDKSSYKNLDRGGSETILFVEDEEMLCEVAQTILSENGYNVLMATDGNEALEVFSKNSMKIDLVLTDLGLPGLDGWNVFQKLKDIKPDVKVVLSSGYVEPEFREKISESDLNGFLQKPYRPDEILKTVRAALHESNEFSANKN